ncbi:MAG: cytochrome P450, partial [Solirubrobacteraceae bacterium]|nr:cytochrome P450 [Solirubrobacteraceae bacterium]
MATLDTTTVPTAPGTGRLPVYRLKGRKLTRFLMSLQQPDQVGPLAQIEGGSDIVHITAGGGDVMIIRNAHHMRQVMVTNQDAYVKGDDYKILAVLLGQGLLTNFDQALWQRQRALVQPLFAKRHLAPMGTHMTDAASAWLDHLDETHADGEVLELGQAMMGLTLDVVGRALFGASIDGRKTEIVGDAMNDVLHAAGANIRVVGLYRVLTRLFGVEFSDLLRLRFRHWSKAMRATAALDAIVDGLIDGKNAKGEGGDDLLSLLLAARDEQGGDMPRTQVRDEVMTFLGAGHETTANAMTWMWLLLSQYPEARKRMQAEVDEVLGGRRPTFDDLGSLPWTNAVFQEAMRLYPPVPAFTRVCKVEDEIDGVRVPRNTVMVLVPYLLHRDPEHWPNPEGFDPERFMPGNTAGRHKQAYMPFGAGRRICVGNGFSLMEGVLLAAMTAQRFEFDLVRG